MEDRFAGLTLFNEEDEELLLNEETSGHCRLRYELCLVGKFLTDKSVNFNAMKNRMAMLWWPGRGLCIKDIES